MNALISRVFCIFYKPDIFTVLKVVCVLRAESFVGDIDLQPGSFRVNTSTFSCERYLHRALIRGKISFLGASDSAARLHHGKKEREI